MKPPEPRPATAGSARHWPAIAGATGTQASVNVVGNTKLILGYQFQYWSSVNVAITDNNGYGMNVGKSDYFIHGPFLTLAANF